VSTGGRYGPACARNIGAREASGELLVFIDSDVCVHDDTLQRIESAFVEDPSLDAVVGSYDDHPAERDFLSVYRNLMHCFVHQEADRRTSTFWGGCGAIRKEKFLKNGGFDQSYGQPAIEDIEFGGRLTRSGSRIVLDRDVQVQHLKRWTFLNILKTDIFQRGVPWTELILRTGRMPNNLNLKSSQRLSVALVYLTMFIGVAAVHYHRGRFLATSAGLLLIALSRYLATLNNPVILTLLACFSALAWYSNRAIVIPPVLAVYGLLMFRSRFLVRFRRIWRLSGLICGFVVAVSAAYLCVRLARHPWALYAVLPAATVVALNWRFYSFLSRHLGRLYGLAAIPLHFLYYLYSGLSFMIGLGKYLLSRAHATTATAAKAGP
jgi:cellulose synthase/poly-beta-1,6-N-acetylglucosamine synthase-like glycosyltransferase